MHIARVVFSFQGRIGRRPYWGIGIPALLIAIGAFVLAANTTGETFAGFVAMVVPLAVAVWITFAIVAKRFRDSGASGWWSLLIFAPLIGLFIPFIVGAAATDDGEIGEED